MNEIVRMFLSGTATEHWWWKWPVLEDGTKFCLVEPDMCGPKFGWDGMERCDLLKNGLAWLCVALRSLGSRLLGSLESWRSARVSGIESKQKSGELEKHLLQQQNHITYSAKKKLKLYCRGCRIFFFPFFLSHSVESWKEGEWKKWGANAVFVSALATLPCFRSSLCFA